MVKRNILFVCNTVFQCITAITLRYKEFTNDNVDIIISDHMNDSYSLYGRIKSLGLFDKTYYVKSYKYSYYEENVPNNIIDKILDEANPKFDGIQLEKAYDILMIYNADKFAQTLFTKLYKENHSIEVRLFDEGLSTYTKVYQNALNLEKKKKILSFFTRRKYIQDRITGIYLFEPNLICWDCPFPVYKIPKPNQNDNNYKKLLNSAFGFDKLQDKYDKKVIFFEESFYRDKIDIGDLEIVKKIAEKVGKENIFVKIHPRNPHNRFEKLGITTNKDTGIPWEIIALNNDFSDSIFITISSSSVLTPRIIFGQTTKTYLLYKCLKTDSPLINSSTQEYFKKFKEEYGENLHIIDDLEEINLDI